jgi:drug/metabolite transporter (DMT)-like permease
MHRSHGAAAGLTAVAMMAFAANSLLCRLALQQDRIDPASFGAVRLLAGALVLALMMRARRQPALKAGDWRSAALLFAYVALFSFAYVSLPAGTGALILFGAVQLTMLGAGLLAGERFTPGGWLGLALACAGLAVLLLPGAAAPSVFGPGAVIRYADAGQPIRLPPPPPASFARRRWA